MSYHDSVNFSDSTNVQETSQFAPDEEYNEFLQITARHGSALPDQTRLCCNNIKSYQCQNCFDEFEDMLELIDHQIENEHDLEPRILMKEEFLYLVDGARVMAAATGFLNSTMLKDTDVVKEMKGRRSESFTETFNDSGLNESGFQETSFHSNSSNSTFNVSQFSKSVMSGLNMSVSKIFCCKEPNCDFIGFSSLQLNAHNRSTHYKSVCGECGKKYANERCLKQHKQRVHEKITKVNCKLCSQGFYSKSALRVHNKNCNGNNHNSVSLDETSAFNETRSNSIKVNHYDKKAQDQEKYRLHCRIENCSTFYTSLSVSSVKARRLEHEQGHCVEDRYECYYCELKFEQFSSFTSHLSEGFCERREDQCLSVVEAELKGNLRECFV